MDAATVHRLASSSLSHVGLERRGRSRWASTTEELTWSVRLDRGASSSPWTAEFSVSVREWAQDGTAHLLQDYTLHGEAVPDSASLYRWDDHRSYFTAAFDHRQDALPETERIIAFDFMASELAVLFARVTDLRALLEEVGRKRLGGFVDRRLREAVDGWQPG